MPARRVASPQSAVKISNFLSPAAVMTDVEAADKQQLLQLLARKAASMLDLPADHILAELVKREQLGSTGMGGGAAIPHARLDQIKKPWGMLVRLKSPIDFDAVDADLVDIVFLLLLPPTNGEQLGALASISRRLRDPAVAAALRGARGSEDMYRALVPA
jgi:nitrogen PTS system EIIA component